METTVGPIDALNPDERRVGEAAALIIKFARNFDHQPHMVSSMIISAFITLTANTAKTRETAHMAVDQSFKAAHQTLDIFFDIREERQAAPETAKEAAAKEHATRTEPAGGTGPELMLEDGNPVGMPHEIRAKANALSDRIVATINGENRVLVLNVLMEMLANVIAADSHCAMCAWNTLGQLSQAVAVPLFRESFPEGAPHGETLN